MGNIVLTNASRLFQNTETSTKVSIASIVFIEFLVPHSFKLEPRMHTKLTAPRDTSESFQMCNEAILKCRECDCVMWTRLFTCRHWPNCTTERWQRVRPQCGFCRFKIKIVKTCNCSCHEHRILEWTLFNTNQCATRNISRSRIYHNRWVHWGFAWICNNKKAVFSIWVDGNIVLFSFIHEWQVTMWQVM